MANTYQEHQNLPKIPDVPMLKEYTIEEREFFSALKECLEVMLGRRFSDDPPAVPQFQMGRYAGNSDLNYRLIETNFRPRYVKVLLSPQFHTDEREYEYFNDPNQDIDWGINNYRHSSIGGYHDIVSIYGIVGVDDDGFYVWGGSSGASHPNLDTYTYDWICFG